METRRAPRLGRSTWILSALAYGCRIEDDDPTDPVCLELVEAATLTEHAASVVGDGGPYERARQRQSSDG